MRQSVIAVLVFSAFASSCATGPKHISASRMVRGYELSKAQTLELYEYCGETNGAIFVRYTRTALSSGGSKSRMLYTETNGLARCFLDRMRSEAIGEPGAAPNPAPRSPFNEY